MKCDNCHNAPAKVHMTEIINENEKRERHLCEECAEKLGLTVKDYSISELLAGIAAGQLSEKEGGAADVSCPSCGMTFADFQGSGRFGCADDYDAFEELVLPRLERFHDSTRHVGKSPRTGDHARSQAGYVRSLRAQLKEAVSQEAYERAAKLRDEIRKLEETDSGKE